MIPPSSTVRRDALSLFVTLFFNLPEREGVEEGKSVYKANNNNENETQSGGTTTLDVCLTVHHFGEVQPSGIDG